MFFSRDDDRDVPWPSGQWRDHFLRNDQNLLEIPWQRGAEVTDAEKQAIAESVREFQLGESSEGRHFLQAAQDYAARTGDQDYVHALRLFIREEQRHARELGRFLTLAGIPLASKSWPDTVFRWLRHRVGLEVTVCVLITAEVIAEVYYQALRDATGSTVLRRICEQILQDEVEHVRFQCERLAILRRDRSPWKVLAAHGLQRFLFWGTCFVVRHKHRRALKAGGYGFRRYWRECWKHMNVALRQMDPAAYRFEAANAPLSSAAPPVQVPAASLS